MVIVAESVEMVIRMARLTCSDESQVGRGAEVIGKSDEFRREMQPRSWREPNRHQTRVQVLEIYNTLVRKVKADVKESPQSVSIDIRSL